MFGFYNYVKRELNFAKSIKKSYFYFFPKLKNEETLGHTG